MAYMNIKRRVTGLFYIQILYIGIQVCQSVKGMSRGVSGSIWIRTQCLY